MKKDYKGTNISSDKRESQSALDISTLLKGVLPEAKKKKSRSKRFERIARLLENN